MLTISKSLHELPNFSKNPMRYKYSYFPHFINEEME